MQDNTSTANQETTKTPAKRIFNSKIFFIILCLWIIAILIYSFIPFEGKTFCLGGCDKPMGTPTTLRYNEIVVGTIRNALETPNLSNFGLILISLPLFLLVLIIESPKGFIMSVAYFALIIAISIVVLVKALIKKQNKNEKSPK